MKEVNKIIRYLLRNFGFKGGRYLISSRSINELIELTKINKDNLPGNFHNLVRSRWKKTIKTRSMDTST